MGHLPEQDSLMTESQTEMYQRLQALCICSGTVPVEECLDENCPACSQLDPEWPCIMDVLMGEQ